MSSQASTFSVVLYNWVIISISRARYSEATALLAMLGKVISQKSGFKFKEKAEFRVRIYSLYAKIALCEKNYSGSIEHAQKALKLIDDQSGYVKIDILNMTGILCSTIGNHERAYGYHQEALTVLTQGFSNFNCKNSTDIEKYYELVCVCYFNISVEAYHLSNKSEGESFLQKAKDIVDRYLHDSKVSDKVMKFHNESFTHSIPVTIKEQPVVPSRTKMNPNDMLYSSPHYFKYFYQGNNQSPARRHRSSDNNTKNTKNRRTVSLGRKKGAKSALKAIKATYIQKLWRGYKDRQHYQKLKESHESLKLFCAMIVCREKAQRKLKAVLCIQQWFKQTLLQTNARIVINFIRWQIWKSYVSELKNGVCGLKRNFIRCYVHDFVLVPLKIQKLAGNYLKNFVFRSVKTVSFTFNRKTQASLKISASLKSYIAEKRYRKTKRSVKIIENKYKRHLNKKVLKVQRSFMAIYNNLVLIFARAVNRSNSYLTYSTIITEADPVQLSSEDLAAAQIQAFFKTIIQQMKYKKIKASSATLQRFVRGHQARSLLSKKHQAMTFIQSVVRKILANRMLQRRQVAARKLQKWMRKVIPKL